MRVMGVVVLKAVVGMMVEKVDVLNSEVVVEIIAFLVEGVMSVDEEIVDEIVSVLIWVVEVESILFVVVRVI